MTLYRARIKLESPIITSLKGDTIWGHIVWGIANHEGDEKVKEFLEQSRSATPPIIVSSAFPVSTICKPIFEPQERLENMSKEEYAKIKKVKKEKYVSSEIYLSGVEKSATLLSPFETTTAMHNTISRTDNTVVQGGLFATDEIWPTQEFFELYVLSSYSSDKLYQLLEYAFENGYGADSSTGKGKISVIDNIVPVEPKKNGTKYVALAPFVCDLSKVKNLRADTFVRSGKIGGSFSSELSPWKKTVILYDEGAVFESKEKIQFIGKLLTDVHLDKRICQSGFAPVIPIE